MTVPHTPTPLGGWSDETRVSWYLDRLPRLTSRAPGEQMLAELLPAHPRRLLDLGCGDGVLARLALDRRPGIEEVLAVDISEPMLTRARAGFADDARVTVARHDLNDSLATLPGPFDVVTSGFAIHHLEDARKRQLYAEAHALLSDGGVLVNLDAVASPSAQLHRDFLEAIGRTADDPEDRLARVADQLDWLDEAGFATAACMWQWRGFAVLAAWKSPY